jgi:hypothetical protein
MPVRARPNALGVVQAFSALGNMMAAGAGIALGEMQQTGAIGSAWRWEFMVGALPAPLALLVFKKLKEPEQWLKARAEKKRMGSFRDLFSDPPLAEERHLWLTSGIFRRGRTVGDRIFQLRLVPPRTGKNM